MNIAGHTIFTITQLSNQVKYALERDYGNLWIQGEISSCKPYPSGHIYMSLKDDSNEIYGSTDLECCKLDWNVLKYVFPIFLFILLILYIIYKVKLGRRI